MIRKLTTPLSLGIALLFASTLQAAIIDNFDDGNVLYIGPNTSSESGLGANTLGGTRATSLSTSGTKVEINNLTPAPDTTGLLAFSNDFGTAGTLVLDYLSGVGQDLTTGGNNAVVLNFLNADQPLSVSIFASDSSSNADTKTLTKSPGAGPLNFLFSDFAGVNFGSTSHVVITMTPNNTLGGDYLVDLIDSQIVVVPEPSSIVFSCLIGLGAIGFGLRRRMTA